MEVRHPSSGHVSHIPATCPTSCSQRPQSARFLPLPVAITQHQSLQHLSCGHSPPFYLTSPSSCLRKEVPASLAHPFSHLSEGLPPSTFPGDGEVL